MSVEFRRLLLSYGIEHNPTLDYNPQGNSICERIHREVKSDMRIYKEKKLELTIGKIADGLRSTFHRALQSTPNNVVFGRNKFDATIKYKTKKLLQTTKETKQVQSRKDLNKVNKQRKQFSFKGRKVLLKENVQKKLDSP